jgi:multiple antibiotic resistance protein
VTPQDLIVIEFGTTALLTLFVVIDPAGLVPVFVSLAGGRSPQVQARIARRAVLIAGAVLLSFAIVGGPLLAYLGISVFALRIAGGILLYRIAVDMVSLSSGARRRRRRPKRAPRRTSPSFRWRYR